MDVFIFRNILKHQSFGTFFEGTEMFQVSLKNIFICISKLNESVIGLEWHYEQ